MLRFIGPRAVGRRRLAAARTDRSDVVPQFTLPQCPCRKRRVLGLAGALCGDRRHVLFAAPLAFLASTLAHRTASRRGAVRLGCWGIVLPIALAIAGSAFGTFAMIESGLGHPKMANLAEALWAGDAMEFARVKQMFAALTMFGLVRLAALVTWTALPFHKQHRRIKGPMFVGVAAGTAPLPTFTGLIGNRDVLSAVPILFCAAGALTADLIIGIKRDNRARWVDWTGFTAAMAGIGPLLLTGWPRGDVVFGFQEWGWRHWILLTYGSSFAVCLAGRCIEKGVSRVRLRRGKIQEHDTALLGGGVPRACRLRRRKARGEVRLRRTKEILQAAR